MSDFIIYPLIGLVILFILYSKGIILADFDFASPKEAMELIESEEKNVTILDVRTKDEYQSGHIKNAILIPVGELEARLGELQKFKNTKILVYCASGSRSVAASRILKKNGFTPYNMNGGIHNWKNSGYSISK